MSIDSIRYPDSYAKRYWLLVGMSALVYSIFFLIAYFLLKLDTLSLISFSIVAISLLFSYPLFGAKIAKPGTAVFRSGNTISQEDRRMMLKFAGIGLLMGLVIVVWILCYLYIF